MAKRSYSDPRRLYTSRNLGPYFLLRGNRMVLTACTGILDPNVEVEIVEDNIDADGTVEVEQRGTIQGRGRPRHDGITCTATFAVVAPVECTEQA